MHFIATMKLIVYALKVKIYLKVVVKYCIVPLKGRFMLCMEVCRGDVGERHYNSKEIITSCS